MAMRKIEKTPQIHLCNKKDRAIAGPVFFALKASNIFFQGLI
jgi:hypothetical protein